MLDRWISLCRRLGNTGDPRALHVLIEGAYANPPRAYHDLDHVHACLDLLDRHRGLAQSPDTVEFALWLHDAVYRPGSPDNEEQSAAIAAVFLRELGAAPHIPPVRSLILATRHQDAAPSGDLALIADIDMAILAASPQAYQHYSAAIRQEYAFVSDDDYRRGRAGFLERLLDRTRIFHSPIGWALEAAARANISAEIDTLTPRPAA